jgi:hypothetical protein
MDDRGEPLRLGERQSEQPAARVPLVTALAEVRAASVVKMSRSAISTVAEGSGASVYARTSPLQRFQRDVEVLKGHVVFDW